MTYEELLQKYLEYEKLGAAANEAAFNKVKELLGEHIADLAIAEKYGGKFQSSAEVLRRGKKGAPILDRVYDLGEGRFLYADAEELVIVDAKFGSSQLGRSQFRDSYLVQDGLMTRLPQARQVEQLDANWIKYRIEELAIAEEKAAAAIGASPAENSLSRRLRRAAENKKLKVLEVRSSIQVENGIITGINAEIIDRTEHFNEQLQTGRRLVDEETRFARREAIDKLYVDRTKLVADGDAKALKEAQARLRKANSELKKAQRELANAKKPETRATRREVLETKRTALGEAEGEFKRAKKAAAKSTEALEIYQDQQAKSEKLRKSAEAKKKAKAWQQSRAGGGQKVPGESLAATQPDAPKNLASEAKNVEARTTGDAAVAQKGVGDPGTAGKLNTDTAVRAEGGTDLAAKGGRAGAVLERGAPRIAEVSRLESVARFAIKGGRVLKSVGKFVFAVFELANPILDALMIVDGLNFLISWADRERIEEQKEWARIAFFLTARAERVRLAPYGFEYLTSMEENVSALCQLALSGQKGNPDNFLTWINKWNSKVKWGGFVYATVAINLERQMVLQDSDDDPNEYTYYLTNRLLVTLSDSPPQNSKRESGVQNLGPAEEHNKRTNGRQAPYSDPKYSISVESRQLEVVYTYRNPTLTPFDFMIVKCNELLSEFIAFLSKYDPYIAQGMEDRSELMPGVSQNWFAGYKFQTPLHGPYVMWCLDAIHSAIDRLKLHVQRTGDSRFSPPAMKLKVGHARRLQILASLTGLGVRSGMAGRPTFKEIGDKFADFLTDPSPRYLVKPIDRNLDYLKPSYLARLAFLIHEDLTRSYYDCERGVTGLEYAYEGRRYA